MVAETVLVRGTNDKPAASEALALSFEQRRLDGQLFIGYPIIGAADGKHPIDAVFVSPEKGVVVFDLVDGNDVGAYQDRQDDTATKLSSRLLTHRDLVSRRTLRVPIHTLTFAPGVPTRVLPADGEYLVANVENLDDQLAQLSWNEADDELYQRTLSALQSISTIRKARRARSVEDTTSRGARLQRLEDSIATLDNLQGKAVIETVDGVQRLRGLAGSGKTIVLALKAAYLHAQHPDWRIAVTFNTRSLKEYFTKLINNFSIEQTGEEPDWRNVRIINAWGAPGGTARDGIYHEFCEANDVDYLDFNAAKSLYGRSGAFEGACGAALGAASKPRALYDAILVDEAQDFFPDFLRLCYAMLDDHKRLVYAYDELQNLTGSGLPAAEDLFGLRDDGTPQVSFEPKPYDLGARRDIILEKCYRNSRPVLVTAHGLGFGIYRPPPEPSKTGLVQMFDQTELWTDIGYRIRSGQLAPGKNVVLHRTADTSPVFLESHSPIDDLVKFNVFRSADEQNDWVAEQIQKNLEEDELRHDDIVVINTDPISTRRNLGPLRKKLLDRDVMSHVAGVDTAPDVFFKSDLDSITFTGIYRAKGNEAGMVYIVNAQESHASHANLARLRNRLFTAITRSKAWVRVVGYGSGMRALAEEFEQVRAANFELRFRYPTDKELSQLQVVHRDMSEAEERAVNERRASLKDLVADLSAGRVFREDLDEEDLARLREILDSRGD